MAAVSGLRPCPARFALNQSLAVLILVFLLLLLFFLASSLVFVSKGPAGWAEPFEFIAGLLSRGIVVGIETKSPSP